MTSDAQQMMNLINQGRLGMAILWEAFETGGDSEFGLLNGSGVPGVNSLFPTLLSALGVQ
jgi:hypothetical protein